MKFKEKEKAVKLRRKGNSLKEIAGILGVAKGTVSLWVRDVPLSKNAQARLRGKLSKGQLVAQEARRQKTSESILGAGDQARQILKGFHGTRENKQILCTMIWWCEGSKHASDSLYFTNSDPALVATFLRLFRDTFDVDESKFRVCMHLHAYHNESKQKEFWARVTNIPEGQFLKTYQKSNTGKRTKDGYPGCVQVRYYDIKLKRIFTALAQQFMQEYRGVR